MLTRHQCSNGARVVLEKIPAVRSVSIGIWIGTGSRNETAENNGVSHFLEHMFFKGTETRNAREIAESFDRIGGHVNAFTSKEYTCFYSKVLDEHAEHALDVLADMFFHSTFSTEELNKEKHVVFEEIKMYEDTPDEMVHDLLGEAVFGDHPLGYPILGNEQSLNSFNSETLRNYMKDSYTPDNVVISIAGNVDESILKKVEEYFGSYQANNEKHSLEEPDFQTSKVARKKETEQAHLCLGFNGLPVRDKEIYGLSVLNNVLGGSMSSRLFQEVREERGLAYSIFSYHSSFRDNGVLTIYGGTGADRVDELYTTISDILKNLKENGITETELDNSKEQIKGNLMLGLESTNSRMSLNGKNELLLGRQRTLDDMISEIQEVSKSQVDSLARSIFTDRFSCSLVSPDGTLPKALK
ncbi:MAG TPA: pitrilysin family protein [Bacillales bacterium]|nr:pitrilysin family protein [Bacillales bacterium]